MISSGDPYRTLGLPPGAPLLEVKRAYRRLAKEFHPDRAGPAALPRFLAIKAAYEMLTGTSGGRTAGSRASRSAGPAWPGWTTARGAGTGRPAGRGAGPGPRAAGSDSSARAERPPAGGPSTGAGSTGAGKAGPAGTGGAAGPAGPRARPRPSEADPFAWARQGRRPPGADDRPGGPASGRGGSAPGRSRARRAATRRATLGSTSYDDAVHEEERAWHGAAWYGVTTGTYWRPNPREYADPRKHGPEYEARARRAAAGLPLDEAAPGSARGSGGPTSTHGASARPTDAPPRHRPDLGRGPASARSAATPAPARSAATPARTAEPILERLMSALLATPVRARLTFALAGWPLLALLAVGGAGELTGCGRYAAGCPVDAETWTLVARVAAVGFFGALLALPSLALRATIAGLVALVVALPGAALLAVFGGSRDPAGASAALTVLVAGAWLVGAVGAATGRLRLPPTVRARVPWWP